jgi:hypothetical protein
MFVAIVLFMLAIYSAQHGNYLFAAIAFFSIIPGFFWGSR